MLVCKPIPLNADLMSGDKVLKTNRFWDIHIFLSFDTIKSHLLRLSFIPTT